MVLGMLVGIEFDALTRASRCRVISSVRPPWENAMLATQNDVALHADVSPLSLEARLAHARQCTDELFALVQPDSLYERPIAERHRIIFYIGHLEAFDWNLFHERVLGLKSFHPEFDRLFAFGIDPVGGGLPTDQPSDWPSIAAVRDYVRKNPSGSGRETRGRACRFASSRPATDFP